MYRTGPLVCLNNKAIKEYFDLYRLFVLFYTGDIRVNQNLGNALLQNLFLRLHNNLASKLSYLNQFWTDEILYQETRKIIGAVIQHITYDHYLPVILGIQQYIVFMNTTIYCKTYDIFRRNLHRVLWFIYSSNNIQ